MNTLALTGGGTRGILQTTILEQIEKLSNKFSYQLFDLIGGTSVGSIVGGCCALGISASNITKFFTISAPKIFSGASWIPINRLWKSAKYSPDNLKASLIEIVGTKLLSDCKTKFIATGFEMKTGRITYFQSYGTSYSNDDEIIIGPDSNISMVDIMMASSAAQSYFPGHAWGNYLFWDGGSTGFNAPDALVLDEAKGFDDIKNIKMLSLGAGNTKWPYLNKDMTNPGIATVAQVTFDIAYSGPETAMVWLASQELGDRHIRINPIIDTFAIDDATPKTLASMQASTLQTIQPILSNIVNSL